MIFSQLPNATNYLLFYLMMQLAKYSLMFHNIGLAGSSIFGAIAIWVSDIQIILAWIHFHWPVDLTLTLASGAMLISNHTIERRKFYSKIICLYL